MEIFLDLETLASTDPAVRDMLAAKVKPPGTLKKAESIAAWNLDEKPAAVAEAVAKTALDGTFGSIAVIGLAIDDRAPTALSVNTMDEAHMLRALMETIDDACTAQSRPVFVGHNHHSFDLPYLWKRCVINRVKPSPWLPLGAKAWDQRLADTMLMWDDNRERRISLDNLCKALGAPTSKGELDGSKVGEYWAAGRYEEVISYCMADVEACRQCYRRMKFQ